MIHRRLVYAVTWQYLDNSAHGLVAVFYDKAEADVWTERLRETGDQGKLYGVQAVILWGLPGEPPL